MNAPLQHLLANCLRAGFVDEAGVGVDAGGVLGEVVDAHTSRGF
jgi:hypothetical protein